MPSSTCNILLNVHVSLRVSVHVGYPVILIVTTSLIGLFGSQRGSVTRQVFIIRRVDIFIETCLGCLLGSVLCCVTLLLRSLGWKDTKAIYE